MMIPIVRSNGNSIPNIMFNLTPDSLSRFEDFAPAPSTISRLLETPEAFTSQLAGHNPSYPQGLSKRISRMIW